MGAQARKLKALLASVDSPPLSVDANLGLVDPDSLDLSVNTN
jgi:hypothetical protein